MITLGEDEISEAERNGVRVRTRDGRRLAPVAPSAPEKKPEGDSAARQLLGVLKGLASAIERSLDRPAGAAPQIIVKPADVHPEVNIESSPKEWRMEVTSRDEDHRIKSMTFKAVS